MFHTDVGNNVLSKRQCVYHKEYSLVSLFNIFPSFSWIYRVMRCYHLSLMQSIVFSNRPICFYLPFSLCFIRPAIGLKNEATVVRIKSYCAGYKRMRKYITKTDWCFIVPQDCINGRWLTLMAPCPLYRQKQENDFTRYNAWFRHYYIYLYSLYAVLLKGMHLRLWNYYFYEIPRGENQWLEA